MIRQSLWVTFPNARCARLEPFLSHSKTFRDIALMAPSDYAASPLYHRGEVPREAVTTLSVEIPFEILPPQSLRRQQPRAAGTPDAAALTVMERQLRTRALR